jgi:predicted tellurium resistance membrane protein TerC
MEGLFSANALLALLTLTAMEIVLGIDNIIFISILVSKLPLQKREKLRKQGIALALFSRLALLFSITWIMGLQKPLFSTLGHPWTGRDLILFSGGLFLVGKATVEIHDKLESGAVEDKVEAARAASRYMLLQIVILDIVFSLDSVITAVGMANQLSVMVAAMVISVGVMLMASKAIADFVEKHPTIKILALSFLILIGVTLVAEAMGGHINKGYIYFAMFFSFAVEILNIRYFKKHKPIELYQPRPPQ